MSRKYILETSASGKQRWIKLKRTHSHGHDHHHRHHDHDHKHHDLCRAYYKVTVEEWEALKERERILDENNRILTDENQTLRADLSTAQAEVHRLANHVVPELQSLNDKIYADNQSLRQSLDNATGHAGTHHIDMERLQHRADLLKRENDDLRARLEAMTKHLGQDRHTHTPDLGGAVRFWRSKWEKLDHLYRDLLETLELRTERMKAYEEILRRRGIL